MKKWPVRIGAGAAALLLPMMFVVLVGGRNDAPPARDMSDFQNQLKPLDGQATAEEPAQEATQSAAESAGHKPNQVVYRTKNVEMVLVAPRERPLPPGSIILPPDAEQVPSDMSPERNR